MEPAPALESVRILLMGLNEGVVRSLARCLEGDSRYSLTGAAPGIGVAEMLLPLIRPDVALVDWAALEGAPSNALRRLRAARPALSIACIGSEETPYREAAAEAGADFFLLRDRLHEELAPMLERVERQLHGRHVGRTD